MKYCRSVIGAFLLSVNSSHGFMSSSAASGLVRPTAKASAVRIFSTTQNNDKSSEETTSEKKTPAPGHDVPGMNQQLSPEEMKTQAAFAEHQKNCPKLGFATDVRTLIQYNHGFAVISTNSKAMEGFPNGSVVAFAPDEDGNPLFVFSGMRLVMKPSRALFNDLS